MVRTLGIYDLPSSLHVSQSCFGKRFRVQLGDRPAVIALPDIEWTDDKRPYVTPPSILAEEPEAARRLRDPDDEPWFWGGVGAYNPSKRTVEAGISAIVVETSLPRSGLEYSEYLYGPIGHPTGAPLTALFRGIESWFERLRTWIEVALDQDANPHDPLRQVHTPGQGLRVLTLPGDGLVSLPAHPDRSTIRIHEFEVLNLRMLRSILRLVRSDATPSDAHLLIKDAFSDLRRGRYRKAVIDAGSAVEVVLARLNRAGPNVQHPRGQRSMTLGWYVGEPRIASLAGTPTNTRADLVELRNNAIHQNIVPSPAQTHTAIQLARSIVMTGDPLPL